MNDYKFSYAGENNVEVFICSAENADEAMEKFKKEIGEFHELLAVEIIPNPQQK